MSCPFCVRVGVSPDAPLKVLWSEFTQAEAKSIAAAGELRSAISELGDKHPTIIKLRNKLEAEVKAAFTFRHRFQKAEAEQLRRQLAEIESKLTSREKNQDAIIKKRVEDLIRADELEWEAIVARRKADASLASSANQPSSAGQTPKRTKDVEKEEVWKRVNRPEYIYAGVDIQPSGFVGGRGGWRPGLPFAPGWFPSPGASQPSVEFLHGTLIRGHAIIPTVWGYDAVWGHDGRRSYIISIGDQQLPCRLAGVAPKQMLAFHSQRFPAEGIADLSHEAADGQSVWAFLPDRPETLVKANVFRKAGGDFEFNEEVAFAIQARGAIDGGYLVCADNGDFLGIVLYQIGSLDACLSAKSINDWFRQAKLDPPKLSDPYAAIVDVRPSTETPFGAFTGFVINGVIVTRSLPLDAKFTIKKFDDGRKLTPLRCANSKDGKLGFIWCEELKGEIGFAADADIVRVSDQVHFRALWPDPIRNANHDRDRRPREDLTSSVASVSHTEIAFNGVRDGFGEAVLNSRTGHWVGICIEYKDGESANAGGGEPIAYTAAEILRQIEEANQEIADSPSAEPETPK